MSRTTIYSGMKELQSDTANKQETEIKHRRIRVKGGGRKKLVEKDKELLADLDALVEPISRGDPQSSLRWTCKSTPKLAKELNEIAFTVSGIIKLNHTMKTNIKCST